MFYTPDPESVAESELDVPLQHLPNHPGNQLLSAVAREVEIVLSGFYPAHDQLGGKGRTFG